MKRKMKILMLAWRDMKHPKSGGAEIVTDIYLRGLQNRGHEVTLFTSKYENSKDEEKFNNYKIIRKGKGISTHFKGLIYAKKNEKDFDIIIDQINTIPFFTPLLIKKEKRVAFFHQLCREIWFYESKFPVSLIGYILEWFYLKLYRNTRAFVVSDSTKKDLIKYAWAKPNNIFVLENQINFKPRVSPQSGRLRSEEHRSETRMSTAREERDIIYIQKSKINKIIKEKIKNNYFVFVGRLTKSKRVHHIIKALSLINNQNTKLYIIGDGDDKYKNYLEELTNKLNLNKQVIFTGKISNQERNKIMQKAKAILVTSVKEGWGLIVTEANANGTLAITYNADGLRDANKTGLITKKNTPEKFGRLMNMVLEDDKLLEERSKESLEFAGRHCDWEKNINKLEKWLGR